MKSRITLLLLIFFISSSAHAIPLRLDATVAPQFSSLFTDFTLNFFDTGDGLLQLNEITSFSGFTFTSDNPNTTQDGFYDTIIGVPYITGIADDTASFWVFTGNPNLGPIRFNQSPGIPWSYELLNEDGSMIPIPEPATITMLGLGLLSLSWARRNKINN